MMTKSPTLQSLRLDIEDIDEQIFTLIVERAKIAAKLGVIKRDNQMEIQDRQLQNLKLQGFLENFSPGLQSTHIHQLYHLLVEIALDAQAKSEPPK
jgi:chorismate mutase